MFVKKSTHDAVVAERDALQAKLDKIMAPPLCPASPSSMSSCWTLNSFSQGLAGT